METMEQPNIRRLTERNNRRHLTICQGESVYPQINVYPDVPKAVEDVQPPKDRTDRKNWSYASAKGGKIIVRQTLNACSLSGTCILNVKRS